MRNKKRYAKYTIMYAKSASQRVYLCIEMINIRKFYFIVMIINIVRSF